MAAAVFSSSKVCCRCCADIDDDFDCDAVS